MNRTNNAILSRQILALQKAMQIYKNPKISDSLNFLHLLSVFRTYVHKSYCLGTNLSDFWTLGSVKISGVVLSLEVGQWEYLKFNAISRSSALYYLAVRALFGIANADHYAYKWTFGLRRKVKKLFRKASLFSSAHSTLPSNYWAHKVFQPIEKAHFFFLILSQSMNLLD